MVASGRARKMYQAGFKESKPDIDGCFRWEFEPLFCQVAFTIVMNIIHGQTHKAPDSVTLETLAEVAAIADDLQCQNAIQFYTNVWIERLPKSRPEEICPDLYRWILISSVFNKPGIFKSTTRLAIRECTDLLSPGKIPVFPVIISNCYPLEESVSHANIKQMQSSTSEGSFLLNWAQR